MEVSLRWGKIRMIFKLLFINKMCDAKSGQLINMSDQLNIPCDDRINEEVKKWLLSDKNRRIGKMLSIVQVQKQRSENRSHR